MRGNLPEWLRKRLIKIRNKRRARASGLPGPSGIPVRIRRQRKRPPPSNIG